MGGGSVCTIGFFDGVHRGHQCLIRQVKDEARRRGARSLIVTFDRHPRAVFDPSGVPPLLTTAEEKMTLLRGSGVDDIYVLPFDSAMATLTAREFMEQVLKEQMGVTTLMIGYDHHFGRPQGETFEDYATFGRELGIDVVLAHELEDEHVSSSAIRRTLGEGDVAEAARLLGRTYTWTGNVVHGNAIGRDLGFPTANLEAKAPEKMLPARGAYAAIINHQSSMVNIGTRPTVAGSDDVSIEAHIINFKGDLYGQELTVEFIARLRAEHRFGSREELTRQLSDDRQRVLEIISN